MALRENPGIPKVSRIHPLGHTNANVQILFYISVLSKVVNNLTEYQQIATHKVNLLEWTKTSHSVTEVKSEGVIIVSYPLWCKCWIYQFQNLEEVYKPFAFVQACKDNGTSSPTVHPVMFLQYITKTKKDVFLYSWPTQHLLSHKGKM